MLYPCIVFWCKWGNVGLCSSSYIWQIFRYCRLCWKNKHILPECCYSAVGERNTIICMCVYKLYLLFSIIVMASPASEYLVMRMFSFIANWEIVCSVLITLSYCFWASILIHEVTHHFFNFHFHRLACELFPPSIQIYNVSTRIIFPIFLFFYFYFHRLARGLFPPSI